MAHHPNHPRDLGKDIGLLPGSIEATAREAEPQLDDGPRVVGIGRDGIPDDAYHLATLARSRKGVSDPGRCPFATACRSYYEREETKGGASHGGSGDRRKTGSGE
jgi:hypothetical protein